MKRRPNKRSRRKTNRLDFLTLEPRQLLAGDLVGPHQVAGELPTQANIVVNGDFEDLTLGADNFYTQNEVTGWSAVDDATGQELNLFDYSADYGMVLDLDSTVAQFDRVFQDVPTESTTEYLITFDFRNHPSVNGNPSEFTNDFEVWWDNTFVGRFTGVDYWQTGTIKVTSNAGSSTRLLFCEIPENGAAGGDGQGPLLDNIRVVKSNEITFENQSFETTANDRTLFFRPQDVGGWGAMGATAADRWLKIVDDSGNSTDGNQYLNLDATAATRDIIFRELDTTAGVSYYVTFDMRTDGDQAANPDELRIRWNGSWAGTFHGSDQWQSFGLLLTADSDQTRLSFLEPGETTGNGSGPLIDNVRIFQVLESSQGNITVDANGAADGTDANATFIPGAGAQTIGQQISFTHSSGTELTSVQVTLGGVANGTDELITISPSALPLDSFGNSKITVLAYDPGTRQLNLTGTATVEEYQTLLRSLHYFNAADDVATTNRTVTVTATDNGLPAEFSSDSATIDLAIETDQSVIDEAIIQKFIVDNNLNANPVAQGLYSVIDNPGTGLNPTINSSVRVKYSGQFIVLNNQNKLVEGSTFDFSSESGITFPLTGVIRGWQLGIPEFKTGGTGKILIPSALAYGTFGSPPGIPPNAVLVFDIDLKEIVS